MDATSYDKNKLRAITKNIWLQLRGCFRFEGLIPILVAFVVYSAGLNNFFSYDDFMWLLRGRAFNQDWLQIFRPDVTYFDPLVHLLFRVNFVFAGFNQYLYHIVDLTIHAINSLLVYKLILLLNQDKKTATYGSVIFASSFAIADAVLWSSSRVDILATLFSLATLIQFMIYLRSERRLNWLMSFVFFILALGAKGTPLIVPFLLFLLIIQEKKPISHISRLIPFGVVIILYIVLLKLTKHQASLPLDKLHFNIQNLALAFCSLFIPEDVLKYLDLYKTTFLMFVTISLFGFLTLVKETIELRRAGYCILFTAIMPVLILTDFKLLTEYSDPVLLLASPSHRIYLASVGAAFLGSALLRSIEVLLSNYTPRFTNLISIAILAGIVASNFYIVHKRDTIWESIGARFQVEFNGLALFKGKVEENSQIGVINFTGSSGFITPMLKLSLGIDNFHNMSKVTIGVINDLNILEDAEKSYLFVFGRDDRVHNKSKEFRQLLLLNRTAILNPDVLHYDTERRVFSSKLLAEIYSIVD